MHFGGVGGGKGIHGARLEGSLVLMGALTARGRRSGPGGAWRVWREMGAKGAWGTSAHLPGALFSLCC